MKFTQTQLGLLINVLTLRSNDLAVLLKEARKDVTTKRIQEEEKFCEFIANVTEAKELNTVIIKLAEKLADIKIRQSVLRVATANLAWQSKCLEDAPIKVNISLDYSPDLN